MTGLKVSMLWGAAAPSRAKCTRDVLVSARATDVDSPAPARCGACLIARTGAIEQEKTSG